MNAGCDRLVHFVGIYEKNSGCYILTIIFCEIGNFLKIFKRKIKRIEENFNYQ